MIAILGKSIQPRGTSPIISRSTNKWQNIENPHGYSIIGVYKNGTIQRFIGTDIVPPSIDAKTGVQSKDIIINPQLNITARLYVPKDANPSFKIPLLVYFHGGGFFTESASSPSYHNHLNSVVAEANVVAVSNYVDFRRVYVGGDSAGANIAHNMAIRVGLDEMGGVLLNGLFLNCPHFWGKTPIGNMDSDSNIQVKNMMESIWIHAYPNSTGLDDPLLNPGLDSNLSRLGSKRVLVYVAGNDILNGRGWYYKEALSNSKWSGVVKIVQALGEEHDFGVRFPNTPNAIELVKNFASFLNEGQV
ncbi:Arylacetamide deacetylase [Handroanthus impetiginosus]|uniref:Arylacetamide deacetylase n=1 Tax=Handroanthus impetiginosus TaxID=429701 RepID=A0A2G9I4K6_9LAMI|nr:Arylacetamide deacetylase [Handroanthus impetiginosus]